MFGLLVSLVAILEAIDAKVRLVTWGESLTMLRTFPRVSPFNGPGVRLNPGLDNWMIRSTAEDTHRVWIHTNSNGWGIDQTHFYGSRLQSTLRLFLSPALVS